MYRIESVALDRLFAVISQLDDPAQCRSFFEDVCTVKEMLDMAQRLEVAVLLRKGVNYQKISQQVGASTATISRVSKCLNYGSGGYVTALKKLEEAE